MTSNAFTGTTITDLVATVTRCADKNQDRDCQCGGIRGTPSCMFPDPIESEDDMERDRR